MSFVEVRGDRPPHILKQVITCMYVGGFQRNTIVASMQPPAWQAFFFVLDAENPKFTTRNQRLHVN